MPIVPCLSLEKLKSTQLDLIYDEKKDEYITQIDFNGVEKFVPNHLYQLVHKDNHAFLFERQIYNAGFYESIKTLI